MRPEVWALLGVVVGALLSGALQLAHSFLQRRWAKQDSTSGHSRERTARLFDYRRDAYLDFLQAYRHYRAITDDYLYALSAGKGPEAPWGDMDFESIEFALERVGIYGSEAAYQIAREIHEAVFLLGETENHYHAGDIEAAKRQATLDRHKIDKRLDEFREAVRIDLGVDSDQTERAQQLAKRQHVPQIIFLPPDGNPGEVEPAN
ncbi:hypothetical protein ACIG47_16875 [Promicromonospora sp. NPDC052451]|uniref:hypothetical protein n=1 Tax=Promicromonospora sp. NPDC052451 TaxID=3364407 RepID=UPI0037CAA0BD